MTEILLRYKTIKGFEALGLSGKRLMAALELVLEEKYGELSHVADATLLGGMAGGRVTFDSDELRKERERERERKRVWRGRQQAGTERRTTDGTTGHVPGTDGTNDGTEAGTEAGTNGTEAGTTPSPSPKPLTSPLTSKPEKNISENKGLDKNSESLVTEKVDGTDGTNDGTEDGTEGLSRHGTKPLSRASRLRDDWMPEPVTDEWRRQHITLADREIDMELEMFRNHWLSSSGATARKHNWQRAWLNWLIRAERQNAKRGWNNGGHHRSTYDERAGAFISELRDADIREGRTAGGGAGGALPEHERKGR